MIIAFSYVWIAAQLVLVMVESYIVVLGGGVLFFGFASSRWTASFAENVVGYAFSIGAKVFLLYLIVGVDADVARRWIPLIQGGDFFGAAQLDDESPGGPSCSPSLRQRSGARSPVDSRTTIALRSLRHSGHSVRQLGTGPSRPAQRCGRTLERLRESLPHARCDCAPTTEPSARTVGTHQKLAPRTE